MGELLRSRCRHQSIPGAPVVAHHWRRRSFLAFGWAGDGLSFRRWRWKWGRRRKLRGRWGNPAHCENQDDSAVEKSLGHELLPLVAGHHSSIAAVSPMSGDMKN